MKTSTRTIRILIVAVSAALVTMHATAGFSDEGAERAEAREREELERRERAELEQRRRAEFEERARAEERERERDQANEARAHLERLRSEIRELVEAGKLDRAEELEQRVREIARELERRAVDHERGDRPRPNGGELERRMRHLHAAIENLHAGGFHEQAEHLARMAKDLAHAHERHDHDGHEHPERKHDADREHSHDHDEPGHESDLHRQVDSLHAQVERMQDQINELRGVVRKLIEAEERHDD